LLFSRHLGSALYGDHIFETLNNANGLIYLHPGEGGAKQNILPLTARQRKLM
jgi:hypothetical protein